MKPLDLQVFEKHPDADAYRIHGSFTPYAIVGRDKRFTDAELAAEFEAARCDSMISDMHPSATYWAPLGETWPSDHKSAMYRSMVLLRFATRPDYDAL